MMFLISHSDQLSSSIDSSLSHLQLWQVSTVSLFQASWVYKQAVLDPDHQYCLCSCLDNISSSTSLDLTTACCSWMFHAQTRRLCSWCSSHVPAKRPQVPASQVHLSCSLRACQEAVGCNIAGPPCSCLRHNFITSLWCSLLLLRAWTVILYHSSNLGLQVLLARSWFLSAAQVLALVSSLLPLGATLLNKTVVFAHCPLNFSIAL